MPPEQLLQSAWQAILALGIVALAGGFVYGQYRRGRSDAQDAALKAQSERIDLLEARVKELEGEVTRLHRENATLEGENRTLRSVLTGESVSAAQIEAMRAVAEESVARMVEIIRPLEQGITRLLVER